jgi:hypothetical protein
LISAGIVKNNGDDTYSLTKETRELVEQLIGSGKIDKNLAVCSVAVLKLSKGLLEDVVLLRYAKIVNYLFEESHRKKGTG